VRHRPPEKLLRRQLAVRRLFLKEGSPSRDARIFIWLMKRACHATRGTRLVVIGGDGQVDPIATAAAASRRELFDEFVQLLNLDDYTVTNITHEEE
jgi:hypothetical protein